MRLLGPIPPRFPIGVSDYQRLRREGYTYVDKTEFIADVLDGGAVTMLFPRPRRFGKTLNMSTLRAFLERGGDDRTDLFEGTHAWELDGGRLRQHFQRYPVIYLSFKDIKAHTWADAWADIRLLLVGALTRLGADGHLDLDACPDPHTRDRLLDPSGPPANFRQMLRVVTGWLAEAADERVAILIDEYDAPLHAAWQHGYWDQAIDFFRVFYASALKDETALFRGVLTGILKVAKENIFSGLNNVQTLSLLHPTASTSFGFTEPEVDALARAAGVPDQLEGMRAWYNGYRFGGTRPTTLYNPWSIISYLSEPSAGLQSFWKNTSSNALVHELLLTQADGVGPDIATLLAGGTIEKVLDENVALQHVHTAPDALWSLLTFSGYLSPETTVPGDDGLVVTLRIPNREVASVYRTTFADVLARGAPGPDPVRTLVRAMLAGDVDELHGRLETLLINAFSYHDFGRQPVEAIYQAFFLGLLVHLDATHRVTSNREAGYGRADLLVVPRVPGPGAVLELKVVGRRETPEEALERAVTQLRERDYAAEVRAAGATAVHQYAVVFDGKRCWLEVP